MVRLAEPAELVALVRLVRVPCSCSTSLVIAERPDRAVWIAFRPCSIDDRPEEKSLARSVSA